MKIISVSRYFYFLAAGFLFALFAAGPVFADDKPLTLRIQPDHFSPNDDSLQDQAFFYPVRRGQRDISRWRLDIKDSRGRHVCRLNGAGFPALVKWDGFDRKGERCPDGAYIAEFRVWGRGFEWAAEQPLWIDTQPPIAQIFLSSPVFNNEALTAGGVVIHPDVRDDSPIDRWQLQILDALGHTIDVVWSSGSLRDVIWDGTDRATGILVPPGRYRCAFIAWDRAGNESAPFFDDIEMAITAREMLERSLHRIQVNETPLGLIVQLQAKDLFRFSRGQPVLADSSGPLLSEVSVLINAYPDVPVKIDGYSHAARNAAKDRNAAGVYAWRVYSQLVKGGRVKASRLTVRGRGHSPMFDRRSVKIPVIENGVEVLLEGNRQW